MYKRYFKHLIDFVIAFFLLLLLSPLLLLVALLLVFQNKGTPFFFQKRPGLHKGPFHIIKFKTMTDEKDENGNLLPDADRMTTLGKTVRKLSIDELPQLINILKGDMSLVGPRPLLFKYVPLYSKEQLRRHHVRPGITGLAQVSGRNSISWTKKFEYDVEYVDNLSFKLDCSIIKSTLFKVIKSEGVNQTESRPMNPFNGQN